MRRIFVLAGLLLVLPVEQVLAQAAQQEAVSVQQTTPSVAAARLLRVPPLTPNAALLLRTSSDRALLDTDNEGIGLPPQDVPGIPKKVIWGAAIVAGIALIILLIIAATKDEPSGGGNSECEGGLFDICLP